MRTLLVPAAGRSSRYPDLRPKWVLTHPTGKLMIDMVLEAMDYRQFDRTVITVLKKHCEQHQVDVMLRQIFGSSIDILVLENCILYKTDQKPLENDQNWQQEFELD